MVAVLLIFIFATFVPAWGAMIMHANYAIKKPSLYARDTANVSLLDDGFWNTNVRFGSQNTTLPLLVDFTSSWIVLGSSFEGCNMTIRVANQFSNVSNSDENTCVFMAPYSVQFLTTFRSKFNSTVGSTVYYDNVAIGDLELQDTQFLMSTEGGGTLGLGLANLGSYYEESVRAYHRNFVQTLHDQDQIASSVLSMWFDPTNGSTSGQFVFGGYDTSKYSGSLYRLPMVNLYEHEGLSQSPQIEVVLDSISSGKFAASLPIGVQISPEHQTSYLPLYYVDAIGKAYAGKYDTTALTYYVDEKYASLNDNLTFLFLGFNLTVPLKALLSTSLLYQTQQNLVYFSFQNSSSLAWLGLDVLKHAYIAIDYDSRLVAMAQGVDKDPGVQNIVEATSGLGNIAEPSAANSTTLAVYYYLTTTDFLGSGLTMQTANTSWTGLLNGGAGVPFSLFRLILLFAATVLAF